MLFGSLFMATLFNFIFRRSMGEERNLLDKILILTFKVIFFPLIVTKGNLWASAGRIGLAAGLMMLELHPVLTGRVDGLCRFLWHHLGPLALVPFYGMVT